MANEIKDAKDGLATRLQTISGLRVIDHLPDAWNEFPAAVIRFTGRSAMETVGGSSFTGQIVVTVLLRRADELEAMDDLDDYMAPLGTKSIEAAIDGDNTWNGKIDDGRLVNISNVGYRELWGGRYMAADFNCQFIKQVTT